MENPGKILLEIIEKVKPLLQGITDSQSEYKPDGKWSKKEILGHLIDSANHNHKRFVQAQQKDDLLFEGYEQDHWVALQGYQTEAWESLINLWFEYNRHISHLIAQISIERMSKPVTLHNLDLIAWKTIPKAHETNLYYFICDYIAHLEHHIRQILSDYQPCMIDNY